MCREDLDKPTYFFLSGRYTGAIRSAGGGAVVYLDLVGLLNFLVDFFLILGANRLTGFPPGAARAVPAAMLGGIYGAACLVPGFAFLGNTLWRTVSLALMSVLAFGWNLTALRRAVVFTLLSMALGGIAMGVNRSDFGILILCALGLWILCMVGFGGQIGAKSYVPVEFPAEVGKISVLALRDTGNLLKDPVSGEQVLVADPTLANQLLGLTREELSCPVQTIASGKRSGLRLIPFSAVGGTGMLLAYRFRGVKIGNRICDPLVAFAAADMDRTGEYRMLTGGV